VTRAWGLLAALLLAGCGGATAEDAVAPTTTSAKPSTTLVGFEGDSAAVMSEIIARLGPESLITEVMLVRPPGGQQTDGTPTVTAASTYLRMVADYSSDEMEQQRAFWQSSLMLSAYWRGMRALGSEDLWGGKLLFQKGERVEAIPGLSGYLFQSDSPDYLFMNAGGRPASLNADEHELEEAIRQAADRAGAEVTKLNFAGALGTVAEVHLTGGDPRGFLTHWTKLFPKSDDLEGYFVLARDPQGSPLFLRSFSTGLKRGVGFDGPEAETPPIGTGTTEKR
jgi:hypothetical protein